MSSYYPEGPMRGSGIYDFEAEGFTECEQCGRFVSAPLTWRGLHYTFTCPVCGDDGEGSL